jgi:nucleoside-diphosphate-sugar epimerase
MRVFLTGATGFIGSAIVKELQRAGHQILGFARSDASAATLDAAGVEVHCGVLEDLDSLKRGAKACDGVIHTAFIHDWSQFMTNVETDRRAVEALVGALQDSGKPLVITSGTMMVAHGRPATEQDAPMSVEVPRAASEAMVLAAASHGVRGSVVRLAPTVHGAGDHGFVPRLINLEKGLSAYVGDGANRWPAVHRLDAARLFRLAIEGAQPGTRLHGVAEEGVPFRAIAQAIGEGLGVPVRSLTTVEASAHFDFLARFVATDNPTSSAVTRSSLARLKAFVEK